MGDFRNDREDRMNIGLGKLPPQATDIEEVVLGAIMMEPNSIISIIDLLKPDIFYDPAHQHICSAVLALHHASKKIDILTVTKQLKTMELLEYVGGAYKVTEMTSRVSSSANLDDHIRIVYQMFLLREQIRIFTQGINECYEDSTDPVESIIKTVGFLNELHNGVVEKVEISMQQLALEAIRERENPNRKDFDGVKSGFEELDKALGGFENGQMITIAGRPGMLKTATALIIVKHIALRKEPVGVFSLEMTAKQLYRRIQSSESGISNKKIRLNVLNEKESQILFQTDGQLADLPIYIDETPALDIDSFRAKATLMKHKYGIKAIFVDYLQLMKSPKKGNNREAEISDISGKLKKVAKELNIPVIALSQLSRDVEKRTGHKIPMLSDLRDSGSIEQDSDVVLFLWRPEYYEIKEAINFRQYNMDIESKNLLAIVIGKQREGETFNIPVKTELSTMRIFDHPAIKNQIIEQTQTGIQFDEITADQGEETDLPF